MEKSVKVSAKYIQKKNVWAKYNRERIAFWAKYNGEKRKSFGKIHRNHKIVKHVGQNTIEKEGI